jgi:2',3'-cyclic-nucleotide 2'-phosphodiesterase (5'-nucleotidase family)
VHHDVLIVQAGDYARAVGRVDLALDSDTGRVLERSAQVLEIPPDEPPDPVVVAAIEAAQQEVEELLAQPVGELARGLELDHFQECGIGNLAADALCERMGADLAMVASGQFHIGLSSGTVTLGQLDRACFSPANPCLTEVQGRQILAALERGLDPDVARLEHTGLRGTPFGIPQVSGMVVEYHPDAAVGSRIQRVIVGSKLLDPDAHYRLAHTDAETLADQSYLRLEEDQETEHEVPTILREVMADYIRRYSPVPEPQRGRWLDLSGTSPSSIQIEI